MSDDEKSHLLYPRGTCWLFWTKVRSPWQFVWRHYFSIRQYLYFSKNGIERNRQRSDWHKLGRIPVWIRFCGFVLFFKYNPFFTVVLKKPQCKFIKAAKRPQAYGDVPKPPPRVGRKRLMNQIYLTVFLSLSFLLKHTNTSNESD